VNCSATGSTASKSEEFELTTGGHEDATSTTALAGSLVSNAAAADEVETVSDTAAAADAADAEAYSWRTLVSSLYAQSKSDIPSAASPLHF